MSEIYVLSGEDLSILPTLEAVRRRPQMYVGDLTDPLLPLELVKQALCHALDEAASGRCTQITVAIQGNIVDVSYDAGMSLEIIGSRTEAQSMISEIGACHNLKENMEVGDEYCTVGLAVLNAFCSDFLVTTVDGLKGQRANFTCTRGQFTKIVFEEDNASPSTHVKFKLDPEILGDNLTISLQGLQDHMVSLQTAFPDVAFPLGGYLSPVPG